MLAIDTKSVAGFRKLRFHSVDECLAEVDRIVAADASGKARAIGNWTIGQNIAHLAAWIEYGYDGFLVKAPPLPIRWMLKYVLKGKYLRNGLPRGVGIPGVKDGTTGQDAMSTVDGAARYKRALARLTKESFKHPSPAFGKLSMDEQVQLNLRHAELHLGYVTY